MHLAFLEVTVEFTVKAPKLSLLALRPFYTPAPTSLPQQPLGGSLEKLVLVLIFANKFVLEELF